MFSGSGRIGPLASVVLFSACATPPPPHEPETSVPGLHQKAWDNVPVGGWVRSHRLTRVGERESVWEGVFRRNAEGVEGDPEREGAFRAAPDVHIPRPSIFGARREKTESLGQTTIRIGEKEIPCELVLETWVHPHMCGLSVGLVPPRKTQLKLWRSSESPAPDSILRWESSDTIARVEFSYEEIGRPARWHGREIRVHKAVGRLLWLSSGKHQSYEIEWSEDVPGRLIAYTSDCPGMIKGKDYGVEVRTLAAGVARPHEEE